MTNNDSVTVIIMSHKEIDTSDFPLVLDTIENPDFILEGDLDELLAVKRKSGKKAWFVVAGLQNNNFSHRNCYNSF